MKTSKAIVSSCLFLILATSCLRAETPTPQDIQSCHKFVQEFYDWYLPKASFELAIKERSSAFSPELVRALREDQEAQAKVSEEIVGLDGDPFLNSQYPSKHFVVGKITFKADRCFADVRGTSYGKNGEHVLPELTHKNGQWVFVNFHYPEIKSSPDDLIYMLKMLKADRDKGPK
jgi:hypothetical protein